MPLVPPMNGMVNGMVDGATLSSTMRPQVAPSKGPQQGPGGKGQVLIPSSATMGPPTSSGLMQGGISGLPAIPVGS